MLELEKSVVVPSNELLLEKCLVIPLPLALAEGVSVISGSLSEVFCCSEIQV